MEKKYTQEQLDKKLEEQKVKLKSEVKDWVDEKATELSEVRAVTLANEYKEKSPRMKELEDDKQELQFYIDGWALPSDMTLAKMVMNRQLWKELWLSLIQTINGVAFVNGKPAVYGETYLSLITKAGYRIEVLEESNEKVEIELISPDWKHKQKWSYTKEEAKKAWQRKNVFLKYPKRMLRYKAIRNAQNVMCPHIMWGAYLVDEAEEIDNAIDVTNEVVPEFHEEQMKELEDQIKNGVIEQ